jgi:Ca2+-binding RTX toxin-like protein
MSTILVRGNYDVGPSQHLTFSDSLYPAYTLDGSDVVNHGAPDPKLTIEGSVSLSSNTPNLVAWAAITDNSYIYDFNASVTITHFGSLSVNASGFYSSAYGYRSYGVGQITLENDGTLNVTATEEAVGAWMSQNAEFTNKGAFNVTCDPGTAQGVVSDHAGIFVNTGQMTITGHRSAVGFELGTSDAGSVTNSGTITVSADPGSGSFGILVHSPYAPVITPLVINNSGTLTASTAIDTLNGASLGQTPLIQLNNSGTINGEIDLGQSPTFQVGSVGAAQGSQIVNTGTINGAIRLDLYGDDLYDGHLGRQTRGIYLGQGADTVLLGNDGETVYGNTGSAYITGGAGNDVIQGGWGPITFSYANATSGVTVNLATTTAQNTGGAGIDTLFGITTLIGSNYNDVLSAGPLGSSLQGAAGDDVLVSGKGNDTLDGGAGNDTVSYANATAGVTVSLALTGPQVTKGAGIDTLTHVENLIGSDYNDTLTAGATGSSLRGGLGNDMLIAGAGNDTLDGGAGADTASYANAKSGVTVSLGLTGPQATGGSGTDTLTGIENLIGSNYNDTLTAAATGSSLQGGAGDDLLIAGAGNDVLQGGTGNDTASYANATSGVTVSLAVSGAHPTGGSGTDTLINIENLIGSSYNDTLTAGAAGSSLQGGSGDDRLIAGPGHDVLTGGLGHDTFVFASIASAQTASPDLINDFTRAQDRIDVSGIDPTFHLGATPAAHTIVVGAYDAVHHRTEIDLYGVSTASPEAVIWLNGDHHNLTASDFVL